MGEYLIELQVIDIRKVLTMYIELDHDLVPGKLSDINVDKNLPTGKGPPKKIEWGFGGMTQMNVKI